MRLLFNQDTEEGGGAATAAPDASAEPSGGTDDGGNFEDYRNEFSEEIEKFQDGDEDSAVDEDAEPDDGGVDGERAEEVSGGEQPKRDDAAEIAIAKSLGFTEEDAAAYAKAGLLGKTIDRFLAKMSSGEPAKAEGKPEVKTEPQTAAQPAKPAGNDGSSDAVFDWGKEADGSPTFDPDFTGKIEQALRHNLKPVLSELEELRAFRKQLADQDAQREIDVIETDFNAWIEALDDAAGKIMGKGISYPTDPARIEAFKKSPEYQARNKLITTAGALINGFQSANIALPQRKELFSMALRTAFPELISNSVDAAKKNEREHILGKLKKRSSAAGPEETVAGAETSKSGEPSLDDLRDEFKRKAKALRR